MAAPRRLGDDLYARIDDRLAEADARVAASYPGERAGRQPVHTVYVPANHYRAGLAGEWGERASAALAEHGAVLAFGEHDDDLAERVRAKLATQPVEDLRIDFEDGYRASSGSGEDAEDVDAVRAAGELARDVESGTAPPFTGIRCKSLEAATRRRGIRTLDMFLGALGTPPPGFVLTLPKVTAIEQVAAMVEVLGELEKVHGLAAGSLRFEVQVETAQSVVSRDGTLALPHIVRIAEGRCTGLHFGTYDYSAGLGISGAYQSMEHPAADFAKNVMQVAAAGTGVRLSDGSTNRLPVGEAAAVAGAWEEHRRLIRRSLIRGFYQGWDLHPHQLPSRFAATYAFFRENLPSAVARLLDYVERTEGGVLDEPATAAALAGYLSRGLDCGAIEEAELPEVLGRPALARIANRTG
ncbi:aldolase [Prauserella marina]|uniref:HpcH/HpaI aldolase/citrate lyase family protein n=1 Tax=Prauserella marina TaxID=530584 RepID=A0A222VLD4_9PSEU|nr:aldolase/citrate lyase family protein [Prauserella marina]ASR34725.1 aldolase [Prauserella marina]PWV85610.1 HpcH/HpaI aldolase/citrate lyase family protein [Prauserella marina]SDC50515.1 HpcH/HpaI aldolase/citrate lyase family protein [Prauserella marina]